MVGKRYGRKYKEQFSQRDRLYHPTEIQGSSRVLRWGEKDVEREAE